MAEPDLFRDCDPDLPEPAKPDPPPEPSPRRAAERRAADEAKKSAPERAILTRLMMGPTPSTTLAAITPHYTKRISNLRAQGHDIRLVDYKRFSAGEVTVYALYLDGRQVGR